jgi:succinate dehydrogenase/fumarate reductase flavoprotein subunit
VDLQCRVLDTSRKPIPGLYAVGEVTGFGGINGKAALEGTFLGPSIYMGRIVGRSIAGSAPRATSASEPMLLDSVAKTTFADGECLKCHNVRTDVARRRAGYWHFEQVHSKALSRGYACSSCHGDLFPYRKEAHRLDRWGIVSSCRACHGVQPREGDPPRP